MMKKFYQDSLDIYNKIKEERHIDSSNLYLLDSPQELKIELLPDKSIAPAVFKPDPTSISGRRFWAHPTTIRAIRKDIFVAGNNLENLEKIYVCTSCKHSLDLQFWIFCPYCETPFSTF